MFYFLLILLILSVILEGTVTALPLTVVILLCLTIVRRDAMVFLLAFIAGIFLDTLALRPLGGSSIFLITFIFLMLLYQRKYEIYSYQFVLAGSFLGAILFLLIFGYEYPFWLAIGGSFLAAILFGVIRFHAKKNETTKGRGAFL